MDKDSLSPKPTFYGTATVGTKGQIVIPANARDSISLKTGDKVIVIGLHKRGMIALCPLAQVEDMFEEMTEQFEIVRKAIKEARQNKAKEEE